MKKRLMVLLFTFFTIVLALIIGMNHFNSKVEKQNDIPVNQQSNDSNSKNKSSSMNEKSNRKEQKNQRKKTELQKGNEESDNMSNKKNITSSPNINSNSENNTIVEKKNQEATNEVPTINVEQPDQTNSYIGVPSPLDFYYSFHKGHIDKNYTTLDGCYSRTAEVSLIDTVDIINTTCFEVLDGQGTVLGIYMYVKCNSGNCERYKGLVGIETN